LRPRHTDGLGNQPQDNPYPPNDGDPLGGILGRFCDTGGRKCGKHASEVVSSRRSAQRTLRHMVQLSPVGRGCRRVVQRMTAGVTSSRPVTVAILRLTSSGTLSTELPRTHLTRRRARLPAFRAALNPGPAIASATPVGLAAPLFGDRLVFEPAIDAAAAVVDAPPLRLAAVLPPLYAPAVRAPAVGLTHHVAARRRSSIPLERPRSVPHPIVRSGGAGLGERCGSPSGCDVLVMVRPARRV